MGNPRLLVLLALLYFTPSPAICGRPPLSGIPPQFIPRVTKVRHPQMAGTWQRGDSLMVPNLPSENCLIIIHIRSFYEYLLKAWVQGNKTQCVKVYRDMWETSMKGLQSLVRRSTPSGYSYICSKNGITLLDEMQELACFVPGMWLLGRLAILLPKPVLFFHLPGSLEGLATITIRSKRQNLRERATRFEAGKDMTLSSSANILRPETLESLFYLWRFTGNQTYREWGWNIFEAFEKNSRIDSGYVGIKDTLKYFYLLYSPPSAVPLDEWVFNTEAHPLKVVHRVDHLAMSRKEKRGYKDAPHGFGLN